MKRKYLEKSFKLIRGRKMEIKINVTSSEEDRKNVELFEFRRRKEEEFKHKTEEQMDSLVSQNEKEKSSIKDEIRKLEDEIRKLENKIDELDEENRKFEKMKESPYFEKDEFYKLGDTSKEIYDGYMSFMEQKYDLLFGNKPSSESIEFDSELKFKIFKAIRPYTYILSKEEVSHYYTNHDLVSVGLDPEYSIDISLPEDFRFEIDLSETELNWLILTHGYFFKNVENCDSTIDERINFLHNFLSREIRHDFRKLVLYLSMKADGRTYFFPGCDYIDKTFIGLEKRYEKEVEKWQKLQN